MAVKSNVFQFLVLKKKCETIKGTLTPTTKKAGFVSFWWLLVPRNVNKKREREILQ